MVTLARKGVEHVVCGDGASSGDGVRFHEKDGSSGKDVRVWQISGVEGGAFSSAPLAQPAEQTYTVVSGDSLSKIAKHFLATPIIRSLAIMRVLMLDTC